MSDYRVSHPIIHSYFFPGLVLGSSPGLWAATAASYCPSRAEDLPKQKLRNLTHNGTRNSVYFHLHVGRRQVERDAALDALTVLEVTEEADADVQDGHQTEARVEDAVVTEHVPRVLHLKVRMLG